MLALCSRCHISTVISPTVLSYFPPFVDLSIAVHYGTTPTLWWGELGVNLRKYPVSQVICYWFQWRTASFMVDNMLTAACDVPYTAKNTQNLVETAGPHRLAMAWCKKSVWSSFCEQITTFICPPSLARAPVSLPETENREQRRASDASHQQELEQHLSLYWSIVSDDGVENTEVIKSVNASTF